MTVAELQIAIAQLSSQDRDEFARWFEAFQADEWDRQIEADILTGRLDDAGRRADQDFEAGRCTSR